MDTDFSYLTTMTEAELREVEVPSLTKEQLPAYLDALRQRTHDYGTAAYAVSMAATAAFNMMAHELGITGFQASCADLDTLRRTRRLPGPFMVVDGSQALYPQYNLEKKLQEFLNESKPWLKKEAAKNLEEREDYVHPEVAAHWRKLAAYEGE